MASNNMVRGGLRTGSTWYAAEPRIYGWLGQMAASRFASPRYKGEPPNPFSRPIASAYDSPSLTVPHILTRFGRLAQTALTFTRCYRVGTLRRTSVVEFGLRTAATSSSAALFTA